MKLSTIRRILKEDLARSGELPKWLDTLLSPLNDFVDQVVAALRNNLTFKDNFAATVVQRRVFSGVSFDVNPQAKLRVTGVLLVDSGGAQVQDFGWERNDDGTIGVKVTFTATVSGVAIASTTASVMTLVVLF